MANAADTISYTHYSLIGCFTVTYLYVLSLLTLFSLIQYKDLSLISVIMPHINTIVFFFRIIRKPKQKPLYPNHPLKNLHVCKSYPNRLYRFISWRQARVMFTITSNNMQWEKQVIPRGKSAFVTLTKQGVYRGQMISNF